MTAAHDLAICRKDATCPHIARAARCSHKSCFMRALVTWTVRVVLAAAATCAVATSVSFTLHNAEAANDADSRRELRPPSVEPLAVSPHKPPLDAGLDGLVPLPP